MKETIKYFDEYKESKNYRKFLILGDMLELGKKEKIYHRKIKEYLKINHFFQVITFGDLIFDLYKIYKIKKNIFHFNNDNKLELHLKNILKIIA